MINPASGHYEAANRGTAEEKHANLPDLPHIIDLELTNACNFKCLMCPTGNYAMRRNTGLMTIDTYRRIIDQAAAGTLIRFIGWGEPLMHPDVMTYIKMAKTAGMVTHLNTNGSHLSEHRAKGLVDSGLDVIKFSFQGVDRKSYAEIRNTDFFEGLEAKIRQLRRVRGDADHPFITVSTSTTNESPEQIENFVALFGPLVDEPPSVGKTIFGFFERSAMRVQSHEMHTYDRLEQVATKQLAHPDPCPEVWDKLSISWNGQVRVCCNDYDGKTDCGNINSRTLAQAWRSKMLEAYRERLARKDYKAPLCKDCWDYMELNK